MSTILSSLQKLLVTPILLAMFLLSLSIVLSAQSKLLSLDPAPARLYVAKGQDLVVKRVNVLGISKINVKTRVTRTVSIYLGI